MAEVHNGALVASQARSRAAEPHRDLYLFWTIVLGVLLIAAVSAVVVTAMMGQTTAALIIALFTGAFFSRVGC